MSNLNDFCFTPEIARAKITHRPDRKQSIITQDTFDASFQRDQKRRDRKSAKYRVHSGEQYHHSRPLDRGETFWDNWRIVDRGRGKVTSATEHQPNQHLPSKASSSLNTAKDDVPLSFPWLVEETVNAEPIVTKSLTLRPYTGPPSSRNGQERYGSYDPINCKWLIEPKDVNRKESVDHYHALGRRHLKPLVTSRDEEIGHILNLRGKKRMPLPADQGVYDPIKNAWLVLPQNKRIYEGRSFAPVSLLRFR